MIKSTKPSSTVFFVEAIDRETSEIVKRHGPLSERKASQREHTLLDRLDPSKVDIRVVREKAEI